MRLSPWKRSPQAGVTDKSAFDRVVGIKVWWERAEGKKGEGAIVALNSEMN